MNYRAKVQCKNYFVILASIFCYQKGFKIPVITGGRGYSLVTGLLHLRQVSKAPGNVQQNI